MREILLFSLLVFLSPAVSAADAPKSDFNKWLGVYKERFETGTVNSNKKYMVENILEIVKFDDHSVYFKSKLNFFNGHQCFVYGIADYENGSFIYKASNTRFSDAEKCVLKINLEQNKISFDDVNGVCRAHSCGSRGGYAGANFSYNAKRPIRYMDVILKSSNYKDAVDEFNTRNLGGK